MKPICVKIDGCSYGEYLKVVGTMVDDLGGDGDVLELNDEGVQPSFVVIDSDGDIYTCVYIAEIANIPQMKDYELMTPQQLYDYAEREVADRMVLDAISE